MAPSISIRPISTQDPLPLKTLLEASYPTQLQTAYTPEQLSEILPFLTTPNPSLLQCPTFYVADIGTQLVGCGGWTRENPFTNKPDCESSGHLRHFGVHADWAGQSIGRSIFTRCLADMKEQNVSILKVCATLNARGFYERLGFHIVKEESIPIGKNGMGAVFLQQQLF